MQAVGPVAQWLEHAAHNRMVEGSSPSGPTNFIKFREGDGRIITDMNLPIEIEIETDGRWIADVQVLPGCMAYGSSKEEAISRVQALALRVIADRLEHNTHDSFRKTR